VNDEKFKDPRNVTNGFNNFFIMITEKLNIQQNRERRHYLNFKRTISWKLPQHTDNPITETEIKSIIHSLKQPPPPQKS
jgi:hypothetical protein